MRIESQRLALEPLSMRRLASAHAYCADRENTKHMMFLPHESPEETERFIREAERQWASENPTIYEFAILAGDAHVGGITLYRLDDGSAELGWILDSRYQGRGYAEESARALMAWARDALGARRFIAQCDEANAPSRRLMEKLGMALVGRAGGRKNRSSDEERVELTYEIREEGSGIG